MNFLKKSFMIFAGILVLCSNVFPQTGWFTQTSATSEHLQSVCFVNDLTGWTVGYAGKILKTTNGGTNWISQTSPTSNPLLSVFFVSATQGWAVGLAGDIIATGNGGTNWILQTTGSTSALNSVYFISALTGWAAGEFMTTLKTTNGGTNWTPLLSSSLPIKSVFFNNSLVGYIAGNGFLYKTTNGGLNWSVSVSNTAWFIYSVHFPAGSLSTGYAVGMGSPSPPILKSTDSGANWSIQPVPLGNALTSVFFTNISTGWAAGWSGTIMYTSNGGTNWLDQLSNTGNSLRSIYFSSSTTGWAVGDLGTILKTTSGGITAIEPINNSIPEKYSLSQNYPNPFNPSTNIQFDIPKTSAVKLVVYDVLGKEISVLVSEELKAGTYNYIWNASALNSGLYFYKLSADKFTDTRKMVLIK